MTHSPDLNAIVRTPFNAYRKVWHTFGLLIPLLLYLDLLKPFAPADPFFTRQVGFYLLLVLLALLLAFDLLRFYNILFRKFFNRFLNFLMKAEEQERFIATVPYCLACIALFVFFSREVILLAAIFLVVGDTAAAYFGSRHGRIRFSNGKSLEGLLAFVVFGFLASLLFLILHTWSGGLNFALWSAEGMQLVVLVPILVGSIVAAATEFLIVPTWRGLIDDNLLVPLTGAVAILIATQFLAGGNDMQVLVDPIWLIK